MFYLEDKSSVWLYSPSQFQAFFNLASEVKQIVFQYLSSFGEMIIPEEV